MSISADPVFPPCLEWSARKFIRAHRGGRLSTAESLLSCRLDSSWTTRTMLWYGEGRGKMASFNSSCRKSTGENLTFSSLIVKLSLWSSPRNLRWASLSCPVPQLRIKRRSHHRHNSPGSRFGWCEEGAEFLCEDQGANRGRGLKHEWFYLPQLQMLGRPLQCLLRRCLQDVLVIQMYNFLKKGPLITKIPLDPKVQLLLDKGQSIF